MLESKKMKGTAWVIQSAIGPDNSNVPKVQQGDFIVSEDKLDIGGALSHRAMKRAGVAAALCNVAHAEFVKSAINHGMPIIVCAGITDVVNQGDLLEIDLAEGVINNLTKGERIDFPHYPPSLLEIIEAGGLYPHLAQQAKDGKVKGMTATARTSAYRD